MKNKEKFAKEIVDIACSRDSIAFDKKANKLTACKNTPCGKCAFYSSSSSCEDKCKEWSESEYYEENKDDVCEWKVKSNYYVTKCSHDTDVMYGLKQDFKYCPYCGKKIKVVE